MEGRYTHQVLGFLKKAQEMKTSKLRSPICKSLGTSWGFSAIKLIKNHDAESCHNNLAKKKIEKKKNSFQLFASSKKIFPLFLGLTSVLRLHQDHLEVLVKISGQSECLLDHYQRPTAVARASLPYPTNSMDSRSDNMNFQSARAWAERHHWHTAAGPEKIGSFYFRTRCDRGQGFPGSHEG